MDIARLGIEANSSDIRRANKDLGRFRRGARETETATERMNRQNRRLTESFRTLGGVAGGALATIASGLALRGGIRTIADFGQEISTLEAVTGAAGDQMDAMSERARELGSSTRFSATQAAEGMTFLARAGFDVDESLTAIEGTLNLAQAGALNLGRAADIASNVLQGFRLEATEAGRVSDVLAASAASANTNVAQMGDAMSYAAPVAAGLGVSVEESAAAVGVLSDAGIQGQRAGTGLRRVIAALESPTSKMRDIFAELGVEAEEVRVSNVGMTEAFERLAEAGVTAGQGMELFGQRGGPAFEVIQAAIPRLREMTGELENADGAARDMSETMDDNLNGALLQMSAAFESLVLEIGESGGEGGIRSIVEGTTGSLRVLADNVETISNVFDALAVVIGSRVVVAMGRYATATAQSTAATIANNRAAVASALEQRNVALTQLRMAKMMDQGTGAMWNQRAASIQLQQAQAAYTSATQRAAVATNVFRRGLTLLGGPAGVAIMAATALFTFGGRASEAEINTQGLREEVDALTKSYQELEVQRIDEAISRVTMALEEQQRQLEQARTRAERLQGAAAGRVPSSALEYEEEEQAVQSLQDDLEALREVRREATRETEESSFSLRELNAQLAFLDETSDGAVDGLSDLEKAFGMSAEAAKDLDREARKVLELQSEFDAMFDRFLRDRAERDVTSMPSLFGNLGDEGSSEAEAMLERIDRQAEQTGDEISEFARQAKRNIQDELGDTLRSTLEGNFDQIGDSWEDLIYRMTTEAAAAEIGNWLFGSGEGFSGGVVGDIIGALGSSGGSSTGTGTGSSPAAASGGGNSDYSWVSTLFSAIASFEGGGETRRGPRVGGLDGRGGYMAMVHPDERITDNRRSGAGDEKQQPPNVEVRPIIALDTDDIVNAMNSAKGQAAVMRAVQENPDKVPR